MGLALADIEALFERHGGHAYSGAPVSQLEHALQCAQLAEDEGAGDELVTAAFLHDIGHLLQYQGGAPTQRGIDDQHQYFAVPFLRPLLPAGVVEPIRLHVDAKRALCALEPAYHDALSPDSRRTLRLQGGVFEAEQSAAFLAKPHAREAVRLRRWDDLAKVAGAPTADFAHFLAIASRVART
jgi:phosphonate degradation associated HDIG domain protein